MPVIVVHFMRQFVYIPVMILCEVASMIQNRFFSMVPLYPVAFMISFMVDNRLRKILMISVVLSPIVMRLFVWSLLHHISSHMIVTYGWLIMVMMLRNLVLNWLDILLVSMKHLLIIIIIMMVTFMMTIALIIIESMMLGMLMEMYRLGDMLVVIEVMAKSVMHFLSSMTVLMPIVVSQFLPLFFLIMAMMIISVMVSVLEVWFLRLLMLASQVVHTFPRLVVWLMMMFVRRYHVMLFDNMLLKLYRM